MNASHAFRSHLMQQFVTAARNQSRTPIALIGWVQEDKQDLVVPGERRGSSSSSATRQQQQQLSSIRTTTTTSATTNNQAVLAHRSYGGSGTRSEGVGSRSFGKQDDKGDNDDDDDDDEEELLEEQKLAAKRDFIPSPENRDLASSFQQLLQSRRTSSRYRTPSTASEPADDDPGDLAPLLTQAQYKSALDRAVRAGRAAPNHKRTEPFTFKRLLGGSSSTERLAEIAEQVYLREKQQLQQQRSGNTHVDNETVVRDAARRKREKWSQIPAFLVTLVSSSPPPPSKTSSPVDDLPPSQATALHSADDSFSPYDPLPYAPPATERALEDYAAACAATQNVLLSLHAEGLATKWATGSVVKTPAFRALVRAAPDDRVVALVMVGQPAVATSPSSGSKQYRRRYRRSLEGDVLQDL